MTRDEIRRGNAGLEDQDRAIGLIAEESEMIAEIAERHRRPGKTAQQIADEMLAKHQAGRDYVSFDEDGTHWSGDGVSVQRNPIHIEGADLIAERAKTHGGFDHVAHFTDTVKLAMRGTPNWHPALNAAQREALDCIAMKLGRILAGDPNHPDHIDDVIGYATLFKEWSGR